MKKGCLLVVYMLIAFSTILLAQSQKIIPVSPEASALAKRINYPVNLNTGIPDINILLHEVNISGMILPIILQYHAGGFRVNERSTRTGLGWSLSSDIQITRTVHGLDDFTPSIGYLANSLVKSMDTNIFTDDYPYPMFIMSYPSEVRNAYDLAMGEKDGSPDMFNYRLLNKTGSFYFQKNNAGTGYSIVPVPYDDIKITYNQGLFKIVDSDGTTYQFGSTIIPPHHTEDGLEYGFEYTGQIGAGVCIDCIISSWKCKKIINATETSQIEFKYVNKSKERYRTFEDKIEYYYNGQTPGYSRPHYRSNESPLSFATNYQHVLSLVDFWSISSPKYIEYIGAERKFHVPYLNYGNYATFDKVYPITEGNPYTSTSVAGLSLSEISYDGGKVVFEGSDKLQTITVYERLNRLKQIQFDLSYTAPYDLQEAQNFNGDNFNGTLYLDSIHIAGKVGSAVETYILTYYIKKCFGNHLRGHDVWGYWNQNTAEISGFPSTTSFIPGQSKRHRYFFDSNQFMDNVVFNFGGNNIEVPTNEILMKNGMLTQITYPTKGYTIFDFEANKFLVSTPYDNYSRISGGLRIKSINHYDAMSPSPSMKQIFKYGVNEDGMGLLVNQPATYTDSSGAVRHSGYSFEQIVSYLTGPNNVPGNGTPPFYPIPINCYNRNCLYPVANEKKTTYLPATYLDYTYANGAPIYYKTVNEYLEVGYQKKGRTEHVYYDPFAFYDYIVNRWLQSHAPGTNIRMLSTQGFTGMKKSETNYADSLGQLKAVNKVEYSYRRYLRPEMIRVAYSFSRVLFSIVGGNFSGSPFDVYNQSIPLGQGEAPTGEYFIRGQYGIAVGKMLLSKLIETNYDGNTPQVKQTEFIYNNSQYTQPTMKIELDSKGVGLRTYYKYSYDRNGSIYQSMVAKNIIAPVLEESVTYQDFGSERSRKSISWNNVVANGGGIFLAPVLVEQAEKGSILYPIYSLDLYDAKANPLQMTFKGGSAIGISTVYLWGYGGLYPIAKIENSTYQVVLSILGQTVIDNLRASTVSDLFIQTSLSNLRNNLNMKNALVTSYTYSPYVGMTSMTNPQGITQYYKFDNFLRLKNVQDFDKNVLKDYQYNYRP